MNEWGIGFDKISFIGMGYVELCTAVCFANKGFKTTVSTKGPEKIKEMLHSLTVQEVY